jgi:hypothetical protein
MIYHHKLMDIEQQSRLGYIFSLDCKDIIYICQQPSLGISPVEPEICLARLWQRIVYI